MTTVHAGNLVYDVDIDLAKLLEGNEKAQQELENLGKAAGKAEPGLSSLSSSAKGVSAALKMPEVNKLSTQLAQLTGKIGASSDAANDGTVANTKFSGALSSVASKLGAGYVSNVGSATASLIKHAKAALEATNAQVDNAKAAQEEASALQGAASSLVLKAAEEKKVAEAAAQTAQNELLAAEAIFERKSADVGSLEVLLARQKESLKQAEANLTISQSEKAVAAAVKARNAVDATSAKIQSQSNAAVKEVTAAEDRAKAAREASAAAAIKLQSALKLEAAALTTVTQANDAATLAAERHTLATKAQAIAVAGARSALAMLGGPTGILLIAAAGIYSLYQAMRDNQDIEQFKKDIDSVSNRIQYLTEVQAKAAAAKAKIAIETDTKSLEEAGTKVAELQNRLSTAIRFNAPKSDIDDLTNKLSIAQGEYDSLSSSIEKNKLLLNSFAEQVKNAAGLTSESAKANEIYDNSIKNLASSNEVLKNAIEGTLSAAEETAAIAALTKSLEDAGVGAEETANQVAKLQGEFEKKRSLTFEQALKQTEQNVKALKIEMEEGAAAAAAYKAEIQGIEAGFSPEQIAQLKQATIEQYNLQQQLSESKKTMKASKSTTDETARAIKQLTEQNESLRVGLEQGERAQYIHDQVMRAGTSATTAQIQEIERLANAQYTLREAIQARQKAEQGRELAKTEITATKSPLEQIDIDEQARLTKIAEYQAIDLENSQLYEDAKTAIIQQASQARQKIADEEANKQTQAISTMLGAASSGFDSLASMIENTAGKSNSAYTAMFAMSKAFAVAQAGLSLNSAIMQAMADPSAITVAQKMANYAAVAGAGASLLSAISGATMGRYNGGAVTAGRPYEVGENGKPEIFQTSSGQQYMIPGNNGRVLSNSDITGGSGSGTAIQQNIVFNIETTGGISDEAMQQITSQMRDVAKAVIKNEQRPGGMLKR